MNQLLWICFGSAVGGGLRYGVSLWLQRGGSDLPLGTFAVNVTGSFLLAMLMVLGIEATWMNPTARLALTTGLMGGFTTYSTFSYETLKYMQSGSWDLALGNVALTVVGCLGACWLGFVAGRWLTTA